MLAHEATIDATWETLLKPALLARYPGLGRDEIDRARAFAYGGSVIQDIGYYPFGSRFFSNLLHYVRSGDFVEALFRDAQNADELAFAFGALAHYANDTIGHSEAINVVVPTMYPKLRQKFGDRIPYERGKAQHVIVEFSFDIIETARGRYVPDAYRRFIGFEVAPSLLERAFRSTYGLEMSDVLVNQPRAIATYRYAVSQIVPALTEAAWRDKKKEIAAVSPAVERDLFVFSDRRAEFEQAYGKDYQRPTRFARFLALIYRFVPKIGVLKPLSFKAPTAEGERLFLASTSDAGRRFSLAVAAVRNRALDLPNVNLDTGRPCRHGDYGLMDATYSELLARLFKKRDGLVPSADVLPPHLRRDIVEFYGHAPSPSPADRKHWRRIHETLAHVNPR